VDTYGQGRLTHHIYGPFNQVVFDLEKRTVSQSLPELLGASVKIRRVAFQLLHQRTILVVMMVARSPKAMFSYFIPLQERMAASALRGWPRIDVAKQVWELMKSVAKARNI
jgi:hypothetical protein